MRIAVEAAGCVKGDRSSMISKIKVPRRSFGKSRVGCYEFIGRSSSKSSTRLSKSILRYCLPKIDTIKSPKSKGFVKTIYNGSPFINNNKKSMTNILKNMTVGRSVVCPRCNNEWTYKGTKRFFATCTDCRYNVKLVSEARETHGES